MELRRYIRFINNAWTITIKGKYNVITMTK